MKNKILATGIVKISITLITLPYEIQPCIAVKRIDFVFNIIITVIIKVIISNKDIK